MRLNLIRTVLAALILGFLTYTAYASVMCECKGSPGLSPPGSVNPSTNGDCPDDYTDPNTVTDGACNGVPTTKECETFTVRKNRHGYRYKKIDGKCVPSENATYGPITWTDCRYK